MIYALALCMYILCYLIIQIMFLFRGCHVSQHKGRAFIILVVYTIVFKGLDFLLQSPDPSAMSTTTYWIYWAVHTLDTFILIALMAIYADGALGRNWVKVFFYYDLITVAATLLGQNKLTLFLTDHHLIESASLYSAAQPRDLLWILLWLETVICITLAMIFLKKPLDRLISKIPEGICLFLMGLTFLSYIGRVVVMFIYNGEFFIFDSRFSRNIVFDADGVVIVFLLLTLYLLNTVARQKRQLAWQTLDVVRCTWCCSAAPAFTGCCRPF